MHTTKNTEVYSCFPEAALGCSTVSTRKFTGQVIQTCTRT